ncbi:MAG: cupin domain-containing protein [Anaerolineaceae bacterium]|nr:cupin domain-containing protein [Anaerolineaceae bacterium]
MNTGKAFENGFVITKDEITKAEQIDFTPHAKFKGVYLKHLVTGAMTGQQVSSHLVKVEPNCVLDNHIHENNLEIHEVIAGSAKAIVGNQEVDYLPGTIGILPAGVPHRIVASDEGVYILAKFTPALV